MDLNYLIKKADKIYGDDGEAIVNALYVLFKQDIKKTKDALNKEIWYNMYNYIYSYYDLAVALVNDSCLWEEEDSKPLLSFLQNEERESVLKDRLFEAGWVLFEEYEIALLLSDNILIETGFKTENFNSLMDKKKTV
ncbi:TPA: hypothetical protein N2D99_001955 [Clostridium botulinum]|nr:hypothetical protein [Clostridium botulinum]